MADYNYRQAIAEIYQEILEEWEHHESEDLDFVLTLFEEHEEIPNSMIQRIQDRVW